MLFIVIISQALLYICFAVLMGSLILLLIPAAYRPEIHVRKAWLLIASGGIALLSFIPVWQIIAYIYEGIDLGSIVQSVLFTFEAGKSWILTYFIATFLFLFLVWFDYDKKPALAWVGIGMTFVLIMAMGWSSHASSYDQVVGFLSHTAHVTVVSIWAGILLIVSWFSKNHANWDKFLSWFTPVAVICVLITIVSGIVLMNFAIEFKDYVNSWMLPYGQSLLLKHLLIIPLIIYAFINSLLMRRKVKNTPNWDPRPWAKAESIIILLIFTATAALGQQSPPHEVIITENIVSNMFLLFYQGTFQTNLTVQWAPGGSSIAFFLLAIVFALLMVIAYFRKLPPFSTFLMGMMVVLCGYFGLIWSLQS
ncbi:copper resistance D family protein [Pradoshia sp.]